jgi:hypothetical protein
MKIRFLSLMLVFSLIKRLARTDLKNHYELGWLISEVKLYFYILIFGKKCHNLANSADVKFSRYVVGI